MVVKLTDDHWLIAGKILKEASVKTVGDQKKIICEFSVNCGKDKKGDTIFVNCKAWHELGAALSELLKGDSFCGIGYLKEREYNNKKYSDLILEWGNSPMISAGSENKSEEKEESNFAAAPVNAAVGGWSDLAGTDDAQLPF